MLFRPGRRLVVALILSASLLSTSAFAWKNELWAGFGYGPELDRHYNNLGVMAGMILFRSKIDRKLNFIIGSTAAYWHAGTGQKHLLAYAVDAGFRAYFVNPKEALYRPFIQVALGPAYLSEKTLGTKEMGSDFAAQLRAGGGIEIGPDGKTIIVALQYIHYTNFGFKKPNEGINIPFMLSIGFAV